MDSWWHFDISSAILSPCAHLCTHPPIFTAGWYFHQSNQPIFYCSIGLNKILRPLFDNNYTPITSKKWSQTLILNTGKAIYGLELYEMFQNNQNQNNLKLYNRWSISVLGTHQSINNQTVQFECHHYRIFWHICIPYSGYTVNFTKIPAYIIQVSW